LGEETRVHAFLIDPYRRKSTNNMLIFLHELLLVRGEIWLNIIKNWLCISSLINYVFSLDEFLCIVQVWRWRIKRIFTFLLLDLLLILFEILWTSWVNSLCWTWNIILASRLP
jgi:hypothetical protein